MPLVLESVNNEADFEEIAHVICSSFGEPYNSLRRWFIPIQMTVEAAVDDFLARLVNSWKQNPGLSWIKIIDTELSNRIIGVAEWEIRERIQDPGKPQKPIIAYWHPEGPQREFAGRLLTSLKGFMKIHMTRPHLELEQLVVLPEHCKRGAGIMLAEWGLQKADDLGVETCVESVPSAVSFYEGLGYGNVAGLEPDVEVPNPTAEWKEYADEDLRVCLMWRPAGRAFRVGGDELRLPSGSDV